MIRASICSNNGPCGSTTLLADKAKFTVFVRNHQWSSARHVQETLQEFAQVIEKNARKLGFIKQDDRVERLQLARSADGMEPEELDVDATLEDVLICMGTKQLVALITSSNPSTEWPTHADDATDTNHLPAGKQVSDSFTGANKDDAIFDKKLPTAGSYSLATPISTHSFREELLLHRTLDSNRPITSESPMIGTKPTNSEPLVCSQMSIASSNLTTSHDYPHAGAFKRLLHTESLHIRIPNLDSDRIESPTCLVDLTHQTPAPISSTFPQRILLPSTNHPSFTAPSPAELAQFLVKTSTNPPAQYFNPSLNTGVSNLFLNNTSRLINEALSLPNPPALASQHSFQPLPTLAPAGWLSDSVKPINAASPIIAAEHDTLKFPTTNIAILAQFLATQLGAFVPTESNQSTSAPPMINDEILHPSSHKSALQCSIIQPLQHHCKETLYPNDPADLANTDNYQNPGCEQDSGHCIIESRPEKDQSSSSVIDANPNASSQPEMVFLVNRRSKTVSTLCLHIAVGQGAGMEELTEAQIRSELSKIA